MTDFSVLAELAATVLEKPWIGALFEEQYPQEWTTVQALAQAPFMKLKPFETAPGKADAQVGFCLSTHHSKWCHAGNRSGKTVIGLYEDLCDVLHLHPITKAAHNRFRNTPDAVTIWVVSDTEDTTVNIMARTLVQALLGTDTNGFLWNMVRDECAYTEQSGFKDHYVGFTNGSSIYFKHSSQDRKVFQGAAVHKVHHDEPQPKDIYSECRARLIDYDGYFIGTMTPIFDKVKGIPWVRQLWLNRSNDHHEWHSWSLLDNPHLAPEAKERLLQEWSDEEIEARVYGAFIPIGLSMAFDNKLLRTLRDDLYPPHKGRLELTEGQHLRFLPVGAHAVPAS